jgi:hypothetical protein
MNERYFVPYTCAAERSPTDGENDYAKDVSLIITVFLSSLLLLVNKPNALVLS